MSDRSMAVPRERFGKCLAGVKIAALVLLCQLVVGLSIAGAQAPPERTAKDELGGYRIGPGDVVEIVPVKLVPKAPYHLEVGDEVKIEVVGTVPNAPIRGLYPILTDGTVNLGFSYGPVRLVGMKLDAAQNLLQKKLLDDLRDPLVTASLGSIPDRRSVGGEHVVGTDGKIMLGVFGVVHLADLTLADARAALEEKLASTYESPELWVRLRESNSQFYHVILFHAQHGARVTRVKYDGHATILDAVAALDGFTLIDKVRLTRHGAKPQIRNVEWKSIQAGILDTNFKLEPGDTISIDAGVP